MRRLFPAATWLLLAWTLASGTAAADTPTAPLDGDAVMALSRDRDEGDSFASKVDLVLVDRQGRERVREFVFLQLADASGKRASLFFTAPQDVRGVAFHIVNPREASGGEDAQWMYLPVSRQTRRISTTDKRGAFMGSTYSYADLDGVRVGDWDNQLVGEEEIGGRRAWVVERRPARPEVQARTGYERVVAWVDQGNHLLLRQDYFDSRGVMFKQNRTLEVETVDGIDSIMLSETVNLENGSRARMHFRQLRYNVAPDPRLFGEAALARGLRGGDLPLLDEWNAAR